MANLICPICGATTVATTSEIENFSFRSGGIDYPVRAVVPMRHCESCGQQYEDEESETARHTAICRSMNRLTPLEIQAIRKGLAMSRKAFADVTGVGEASLARWENGELIQSESNDKFLRLLLKRENVSTLASLSNISFEGVVAAASPRKKATLSIDKTFPLLQRNRKAVETGNACFKLWPTAVAVH